MVPALSIDGRAGPPLPRTFRVPAPPPPPHPREKKSPLPEDWSDGARGLRDLDDQLENLIEDSSGQ